MAEKLIPQEVANYRTAEEGPQSCAGCGNFIQPDKCKIVQPPVSAGGVCDVWAPAQSDADMMGMLFGGAGAEAGAEMPAPMLDKQVL